VLERLKKLKDKPFIAHLLRAVERFGGRLGNQFGAAITYFSVLALVPLIMLAFSLTGFVLVELRPQLLDQLQTYLTGRLGRSAQTSQLLDLINRWLRDYRSVGIAGLISALYSGAGWMGNLRDAVRAQWRYEFDLQPKKENVLVKTLLNLLRLLGLIVAVGITFALAALSTSLSGVVISALHLDALGWLSPVLKLVPIAVSLGAGWLLFMYLYTVLPDHREPWPQIRRGALFGSVGLVLLQYLAAFLIGRFAGNAAAGVFGPVITLMLFFNLFARLILFVAAWIATFDEPGLPDLDHDTEGDTEGDTEEDAEGKVRFPLRPGGRSEPAPVPQEVAARSVRIGLGAGYVTGAATGVGIGALIASVVAGLRRRRDRG
jgi:membrane protein